ncbi:MAG: phosphatidylserine/phosphatidylglycerophosphate/cardiolipin synthase-like enzyme [Rhodothermales bacterium]|jgi:phosphatidylserine/phosphatidylglycerophosphate/cardiolipin synthase-like enzyme
MSLSKTSGPGAADADVAKATDIAETAESPPTTRSSEGSRSARAKRIAWTPDRLWFALRSDDKKWAAARLGCGVSNVYARVHGFRATSPGGSGFRHVIDRDIHLMMARMLDGARYEALASAAFVSPSPPPVFDHLLAAAGRGVDVRLLFRSDNLTGNLVRSLQRGGVRFRILADLHAKFLITDTTAMNGSANFTQASADRASEVATFFSNPTLVCDLRKVFNGYWHRARPF